MHIRLSSGALSHVLSLAACLALLAGCNKAANEYKEPPPPEVTVGTPVKQTVKQYLDFTGLAQPVETVEIRARVKGFLKEKHFGEGDQVKAGQLLLVIDEEPFQIEKEAKEALLAEAEAALKQAKNSKAREVARAQLTVEQARQQLAQQEEQRQRNLFAKNVATQSEVEQSEAAQKTAAAQVTSAKAAVEQAEAAYGTAILVAEARLSSAKIALRNAVVDLGYCRMLAPIDGRISELKYDLGNFVGDGEASVLATIMKLDPIYAYASVGEDALLLSREVLHGDKGQEQVIELEFGKETGYPHIGKIDYSDPGLDPGTGTIRTRGVFPNPDRVILPGLFVRLRIPVGEKKDALLVPERALGTDQSGSYLLIVGKDGTVEARSVTVGTSVGEMCVVEGNLSVTDQVIVEGLLRARPGARVVAKPPVPPAEKAAEPEKVSKTPPAKAPATEKRG